MKIGEQISVTISKEQFAGKTLVLDVEDFQPVEPSNYAWTAGWNCAVEIRGESVWFFVDEAGVVYDDNNDEVGLCPAQEQEYKRMGEISINRVTSMRADGTVYHHPGI